MAFFLKFTSFVFKTLKTKFKDPIYCTETKQDKDRENILMSLFLFLYLTILIVSGCPLLCSSVYFKI